MAEKNTAETWLKFCRHFPGATEVTCKCSSVMTVCRSDILILHYCSPPPLLKFHMAPTFWFIISSGTKQKGTQLCMSVWGQSLTRTQNVDWVFLLSTTENNKSCSFSRALVYLSLKSPSKRTPFRFPNRGPYGDSCPFTEPSSHISQIPHKNSRNKRNFSLLSKALGKERPYMFP